METITIPIVAGAVGTLVTALLSRLQMTSGQKRLVAILSAVTVCAVGLWAAAYPATWETVSVALAGAVGVCQAVFAALKPTGLLDWLGGGSEPERALEE
jgi:hypothetical protein